MAAMLGIKLDSDLDGRVAEFARARGQSKSEVGRRALVEYLDRHSLDQEFRRQLALAADEDIGDIEDLTNMAFRTPDWT